MAQPARRRRTLAHLVALLTMALGLTLLGGASANAAAPSGMSGAPAACANMHADTPLTPQNVALAAICPETRAPDSALSRLGLHRQADGAVTPDSGGPVCKMLDANVIKVCWGGPASDRHWVEVSIWQSLVAPFTSSTDHFVDLWHDLDEVTHNKYLRACTAGAIGGVVAGYVGGAGAMTAGAIGGCAAATLTYWWTK